MIREYEITYVTKEYLVKHGWSIVAYNPPGSQGTFTIPNPEKDPAYRGQTGSESPDIVAIKKTEEIYNLLIVECKPSYSGPDVEKMRSLFSSDGRRELFLKIIRGQCLANGIDFDIDGKINIQLGKAHGGDENPEEGITTFLLEQKEDGWNPENFNAKENILSHFNIRELIPS